MPDGGFAVPHAEQTATNSAPHSAQNLFVAGLSCEQRGQRMGTRIYRPHVVDARDARMGDMTDPRPKPAIQPYDFANGMRVGGVSGALIGGGVFALTGWPWFVVLGAIGGAVGGYLWYRREAGR